ncbi:hypothetical protein J4573_42675 [Actinomadura barringtoniae]|uniref:HEAT repeat domain-containing protein n=1 Tax=Actinomadura barringtoniae TaxID=1427535 RepID=A0A939PKA1_9ACTN|nr:hypothetical protein [Actinomadura barringtoniae]MBO2453857.1 hypothetical protein [Actinomadura barringtoniae]
MLFMWALGLLGDPADFGNFRDLAAEPTLRRLQHDPDEQVRKFATRGLARIHRK